MIRLQRFMAECGVASRRESERIIAAGRVTVNGKTATLGDAVDPDTDDVALDGQRITRDRPVYLVLNKPRGVVSTAKDTHQRKTVLDCVRDVGGRLFPVGRLDMDVAGALILTNDGDLAHRLMHPKFEVQKVYHATVKGAVTHADCSKLMQGVQLEDGHASADEAVILEAPILELTRLAIANITVEDLQPGQWRQLTPQEVEALREAAGP